MKKALVLLFSILLFSCSNNVYIDEGIDSPIWRVGNVYFKTADDAVGYVMSTTGSSSRALEKTEDENRTIVLTRDVLSKESVDELGSDYSKYVADDSLRGSITIPKGFTGSLTIDFGGHRYDFANTNETFFVVEGGDNIYIYNGTSVIFDKASHTPYAIAVNCSTVTIDEHMIDDRRVDNKLLYVGEKGHLKINNVTSSGDGTTLSGEIAVVTDGTSGARLDVNASDITITNIYTKYKDEDGNVSDEIDSSIAISENAKSAINIYSGNIEIDEINKKTDYYNSETAGIFDKACINIYGQVKNTTIRSTHDVYNVIEKVIEKAEEEGNGSATHYIIHNLTHFARVKATCIATGNIEYWKCTVCGDCFSDENERNRIADKDSVIIPIDLSAHSLEHTDRKAATCLDDGNIEYWYCSICRKYFSDEGKTGIEEENTIIPHHTISDGWEYDTESHWHLCRVDGNKVNVASHSWGEWEEKTSGTVTHLFAKCSVCGAKKVAGKPEYLVYNIGIGEVKLKAIEATPCGDFFVNGNKVESGGKISVDSSDVTVVFEPYLNSNTSYTAYTFVIDNGQKELKGVKNSDGRYTVGLTLSDKTNYELSIQLRTEGGSLGFDCTLNKN